MEDNNKLHDNHGITLKFKVKITRKEKKFFKLFTKKQSDIVEGMIKIEAVDQDGVPKVVDMTEEEQKQHFLDSFKDKLLHDSGSPIVYSDMSKRDKKLFDETLEIELISLKEF